MYDKYGQRREAGPNLSWEDLDDRIAERGPLVTPSQARGYVGEARAEIRKDYIDSRRRFTDPTRARLDERPATSHQAGKRAPPEASAKWWVDRPAPPSHPLVSPPTAPKSRPVPPIRSPDKASGAVGAWFVDDTGEMRPEFPPGSALEAKKRRLKHPVEPRRNRLPQESELTPPPPPCGTTRMEDSKQGHQGAGQGRGKLGATHSRLVRMPGTYGQWESPRTKSIFPHLKRAPDLDMDALLRAATVPAWGLHGGCVHVHGAGAS